MLTKSKVRTSLLLVFGILVLINVVSNRFFLRLDFTEDQRYTLSDASKDILSGLNDPVTVKAYFSENLPPDVEKVKTDFNDLLIEYNNRSQGNVVFEFINPSEDQQIEMEAQQNGVTPIMINVREKDQMKQQKAYLGAILQMGDRKEVIPFIQPGAAMEFALSSNIKKLSIVNKPKIGFLQGHGEPSLQAIGQLMQQLNVMYQVVPVTIDDTTRIPADIKMLGIIAPKDSINPAYLAEIDQFISSGGRLMVAMNAVEGDLQNGQGSELNTNFIEWLGSKGINIGKEFVIDANCASVTVRQQQQFFVMNSQVRFPYIPILNNFIEHPITTGLEAVITPFVSPISVSTPDSSLQIFALAKTSDKSGIQKPPLFFDVQKQWGETDFTSSEITVAAAIEGTIDGTPTKMVVFGDGDFVVNGEGQSARQLSPDNISLVANAVDWLSDDTGLISLRTKGVTARPIDPNLSDATKATIKYLNFTLPILLIIIYGLYRAQIRRKIRNNLQQTDYVQ